MSERPEPPEMVTIEREMYEHLFHSVSVPLLARALAEWWTTDRHLVPVGVDVATPEAQMDDAKLIAVIYERLSREVSDAKEGEP